MKPVFERSGRFLDLPLGLGPRVLLVAAALLLLLVSFLPLWKITLFAPQHPEGLRLVIYSHKLDGGNDGEDLREINILNKKIGMKELSTADFTEFKWMPFVVGALVLLLLRAPVHRKMSSLLDVLVLFLYFGLFSLWSFADNLHRYGHDQAPSAAVTVPPFMPPLFGHKKLANLDVYSYPATGSYVAAAVAIVLAVAVVWAWRQGKAETGEFKATG